MKKALLTLVLFINVLFLLHGNAAKAQVVINEFSCSNLSQYVDNHNDYNDWIELYNAGTTSVNLGGYYLSDDSLNNMKWAFPIPVVLAPNRFLKIWASGRNVVDINPATPFDTSYHTNFTLKQTKTNHEWVVLSDPGGTRIDEIEINRKTQLGHSFGRVPNGGNTWAIFTAPTLNASNNPSYPYLAYANKPAFSWAAGFYAFGLTVAITTTEPNSVIHYTVDGLIPTATSPTYTAPIAITATTILKAITISSNPDILPSFIEFDTYFINVTHTLPVVSISGSLLTQLANGNGTLIPFGSFEYFNAAQQRTAHTYGEFNRHGQDSWANSQRSLDFVSRDEMGYNHSIEEVLFNTSPRDQYQRVILRAAGDDNYPADHHSSNAGSAHLRDAYVHHLALLGGLDLDTRRMTKCVVYLNGAYWGVYDIRDNPDDHDNTNYYYGQDKYHLHYIETWGNTWAQYGGNAALADWQSLHNYILANDMTVPANYQYVTDRLDINSLVDYVLANMFTVCSDWLNWNTGWWRGTDSTGTHQKWGYILWDNDATFGFYINYTGIPNTTPTAAPCDPQGISFAYPQDHITLLNKLRQNPAFNQYYISRQLDLWNTVFSCDNMIPLLDSIVAVIDPEMTQHAARWNGTYTEWQTNVQQLRDFINQRCTALVPGWISCYNLNGPYNLTVNADPVGSGAVKLNSLTHTQLPWTGTYFGGMDMKLEGIANPNYQFAMWSADSSVFNPSATTVVSNVNLTTNDSIVAHFLTVGIPEVLPSHNPIVSAYPTVTSSEVTIQYSLTEPASVSLKLYSVLGNEITVINNPEKITPSGNHIATLNLSKANLADGLYVLEFVAGNYKQSLKLVYSSR